MAKMMIGKIRLTIYMRSGEVAVHIVDKMSGSNLSGGYLVVEEDCQGYPYYLGDIKNYAWEPAETIH